ncbi:MAG: DUF1232 domain-containing protein [Thermodesulfobacteriota bacterium]|jgi:uncharacterized membrane protein YkvA (DUF1232 family)
MSSFSQRLRYYFLILFDRQTPLYVKLILAGGLLYILVPVDIISDTIPLLGWLDDLAIASFLVALALRLVPKEVMARVKNKLSGGK